MSLKGEQDFTIVLMEGMPTDAAFFQPSAICYTCQNSAFSKIPKIRETFAFFFYLANLDTRPSNLLLSQVL